MIEKKNISSIETVKEIFNKNVFNDKNIIGKFLLDESKKINNISFFPTDETNTFYNIANAIISVSILTSTYNAFKEVKGVYDKLPESLIRLAEYNWFIDQNIHLKQLKKIINQITKGDLAEVDKYLTRYYKTKTIPILEELIQRHNSRIDILSEIKEMINGKHYYSAIILILSQVDGISYDLTKKEKFFLKDKSLKKDKIHRPEVTSKIIKDAEWATKAFMSPIEDSIPIGKNEKFYKKSINTFNRHEIMHGVDISYGTEKNTLKALSLLKYLSDLIINIE